MKNYNRKILESFITKEPKETEVSLSELIEYRLWQYKNLAGKIDELRNLLKENFDKDHHVSFNTSVYGPRFAICHKNWSGSGMCDIDVEDITFRFMLDEQYRTLQNFVADNSELFIQLHLTSNENNILGNTDFSTYDTTKQYGIISNNNSITLAYNYRNFNITNFESHQFRDLSIATPFSFGVHYIDYDLNNIRNDENSYYINRENFIKRLILKSILEKGEYKGHNINPFKAIMIDESNLPVDIVNHVKQKKLSIKID